MPLSTFSFIQLQGVGWLTWAIVGIVAVLALFLIFFFVKRINKAEKETEDEWSLTQRSLFTNLSIQDERTERAATRTAELDEVEPTPPESVLPPVGETRTLSSSIEAGEIGRTELLKSIPAVDPEPEEEPQPAPDSPPTFGQRYEPPPRLEQERPEQERQQSERGTELLASRGPEIIDQPAEQPREAHPRQTAPFDDEVWTGLEIDEQPSEQPPAPPAPLSEARVEHRRREMFEPPIIEPVRRRETFEPPVIAPLESPDEPPTARRKAVEARPAAIDRDVARPLMPQPLTPQPVAPHAIVAAAQTDRARERRSGSVLNLPAETSDAPMVYGEIAADRESRSIGSLSNYGKNVDERKGRGWKWLIVLLCVIVAAVLMYYFIRPLNAWVDRKFAEVRDRNIDASQPPPPPEYKAQVYLARGQIANNNSLAKARGRVTNISDAPLENLSVEVELIRKDGAPPDIRTAPVNPSTLAPTQQGIFEVDLDSRVHSAHRLGKLLSKDGEVLFTAPGQQTKQQPQ
jgi:hypothetical protein